MLKIQKNVIWSPKRAGGRIVFASVSELRVIVATSEPLNFVWPDEGAFLQLAGSEDTFKMDVNNDTLPPLVISEKDARRVLRLYDETALQASRDKLEVMVAGSRDRFAKVYSAAESYELQTLGNA